MNSTPSCTISGLARRVLLSPTLDEKLAPTPDRSILEDDRGTIDPLPTGPTRPPNLEIVGGDRLKVPPASGMIDPAQRTRLLHALANHELQAAELFAWALLAYPDAPSEYRRGLAGILADEHRHTRMYVARLESLGGEFGALPVTGYFWNKAKGLTTPLKFVCAMSLTF